MLMSDDTGLSVWTHVATGWLVQWLPAGSYRTRRKERRINQKGRWESMPSHIMSCHLISPHITSCHIIIHLKVCTKLYKADSREKTISCESNFLSTCTRHGCGPMCNTSTDDPNVQRVHKGPKISEFTRVIFGPL